MQQKFNVQNKLTIFDQDSIRLYLQELRTDPETTPLSKEDEYKLFAEYQMTGSKKIKERLIKANLRWIVTVAKQYTYPKARLEDLINEGSIGMITAIDKFDLSRGKRFTTFATNYIRLYINAYINEILSDIVQPANRFKINSLLKAAKVQLNLIGIVEPTDEELVDQYMTIKDAKDPVLTTVLLQEIRNNSKSFVSSHATLSGTEDFELQDTFKTTSDFNTDNNIVTTEKKESIVKTLTQLLGERDANIVMLHFGLNGNDEMTLEQIADRMGYTRERIGQLVQNCIKKLTPHKKLMFELLGSSKETSHSVETNHLNYAVKTM